jgi:uncharacterized protein (TIGR03435 family)
MHSRRAGVLGSVILLLSSAGVPAAAAEVEFAAASIRPSDPNGPATHPRMGPIVFFRRSTLREMISLAYGLEKFQIIGGPQWLNEQMYDVEAKTESPASNPEILQMLRA